MILFPITILRNLKFLERSGSFDRQQILKNLKRLMSISAIRVMPYWKVHSNPSSVLIIDKACKSRAKSLHPFVSYRFFGVGGDGRAQQKSHQQAITIKLI